MCVCVCVYVCMCVYVSMCVCMCVCVCLCVKNVKISFNVGSSISRSFALRLSLVGGLDCPNLVRLLRSSGGGSVAPG